jgi:hypothetical protein
MDVACGRGLHSRSILHLAFNKSGSKLASIGGDPAHLVAVHALTAGGMLLS